MRSAKWSTILIVLHKEIARDAQSNRGRLKFYSVRAKTLFNGKSLYNLEIKLAYNFNKLTNGLYREDKKEI
ncbi:MAG: hypothetical protein HY752_08765 [Nitrospirae bacterium]|nr:hypothetical protein [Nitrospirota bacterium]